MQLQSFLFKEPPERMLEDIRKDVELANDYVYQNKGIRHTGPLKPDPPFRKDETNPDFFKIDADTFDPFE